MACPARRGGDWGVQRVDLFAGRGVGTVKNVPGTSQVPGTSATLLHRAGSQPTDEVGARRSGRE